MKIIELNEKYQMNGPVFYGTVIILEDKDIDMDIEKFRVKLTGISPKFVIARSKWIWDKLDEDKLIELEYRGGIHLTIGRVL